MDISYPNSSEKLYLGSCYMENHTVFDELFILLFTKFFKSLFQCLINVLCELIHLTKMLNSSFVKFKKNRVLDYTYIDI